MTEHPRRRTAVLADICTIVPALVVEARLAGPHNVTGAALPGYEAPLALLRPSAARALARAQRHLHALGFGLKVWDAYRPLQAARALAAWAEAAAHDRPGAPSDGAHSRGVAVDVTLVDLTGAECDLGAAGVPFAAPDGEDPGEQVRWRRQLLATAMAGADFAGDERCWWHFSYTPTRGRALDVPVRAASNGL